jgi:S1-C subfamily serine protease
MFTMRSIAAALVAISLVSAVSLGAQATADTAAKPASTTSGYGAWFGSIPDMILSDPGIVLEGTTPGSPAAKAGLKKGDVIVEMDGGPVGGLGDMVAVLRAHAPGDTIKVVFWREADSKQHTVKVILGSRPAR